MHILKKFALVVGSVECIRQAVEKRGELHERHIEKLLMMDE